MRQQVPVIATVRQRGRLAERVRVSLERTHGHGQGPRPDAPGPPGEPVDMRDVPLNPDGVAEVVFHVTQEQSGLYRYELRADPLPGEVTTVNNSATLLLRVVDQPVRVLLLEGKPYWDTKFLIRTLTADQSIELVSVVKLAENRLLQRTLARPEANAAAPPAAAGDDTSAKRDTTDANLVRPTDWSIQQDAGRWLADRQTLAKYQIVILGRDAEAFLNDDALRQLKQWLTEDSGALVCYRGPPTSQISQRLGELLPVRWASSSETRFRVQLTTEGRSLRWLPSSDGAEDPLADLPSLAGTARVDRSTPLATVLATSTSGPNGQPEPVITYQPVGNGRVVVLEGAGMWRWAFLPAEYQQHDEVYATFWRSLTRWLVSNVGLLPTQRLALRTDRVTFGTEEHAAATLLVRAEDASKQVPRVELQGPEAGRRQEFEPVPLGDEVGQFQVRFGRLPEGRYLAAVMGAAPEEVAAVTAFDVRGNPLEQLEVRTRPELMREIAVAAVVTRWWSLTRDGSPASSMHISAAASRSARRRSKPGTAGGSCWRRWPSGRPAGACGGRRGWCEGGCDVIRSAATAFGPCAPSALAGGAARRRRGLSSAPAVLLLCGAWLDLLWELSPQARVATSVVAGSAGLAAIVWGVVRTLGDAVDRRLVRRMDRAGRCHGQVLTGYELDADPPAATKGPAVELTRGLARIAAGRAADLAAGVRTAQVVPLLPLRRAAAAVVLVAASVGLLALLIPDLAGTQWARFARPFADIPPYSRTKLHVEPGDTCVVFGDPLEIVATASGTPVDQLEVVLQSADGSADRLPMFPEAEGRWRAAVARVTRPTFYCVRAARARSPHYQIQLITVPRIEQVMGARDPAGVHATTGLRGSSAAGRHRRSSGHRRAVSRAKQPAVGGGHDHGGLERRTRSAAGAVHGSNRGRLAAAGRGQLGSHRRIPGDRQRQVVVGGDGHCRPIVTGAVRHDAHAAGRSTAVRAFAPAAPAVAGNTGSLAAGVPVGRGRLRSGPGGAVPQLERIPSASGRAAGRRSHAAAGRSAGDAAAGRFPPPSRRHDQAVRPRRRQRSRWSQGLGK